MRTFFAALIAAAAITAPGQALAAKPQPTLQVTASVAQTGAVAGTGCIISATGTWDGARVAGVGFAVYDSSGGNQGYVEGGAATLDPRPARSGSVSWTATKVAVTGEVRVEAVFFDHRGFDVGRSSVATIC